jgi:hypothetical protein
MSDRVAQAVAVEDVAGLAGLFGRARADQAGTLTPSMLGLTTTVWFIAASLQDANLHLDYPAQRRVVHDRLIEGVIHPRLRNCFN